MSFKLQGTFICSLCSKFCATHSNYGSHLAMQHPYDIALVFKGDTQPFLHQTRLGPHSKFTCVSGCPFTSTKHLPMLAHAASHVRELSNEDLISLDPKDEPERQQILYIPDQDQNKYHIPLNQEPVLTTHGLAYHSILQVFICTICKNGVRGSHLLAHCQQHSLPTTPQDILDILATYTPHTGSHPPLPSFTNSQPMVALPLLPIQEGFSCHLCRFCCPALNTMKNHFSRQHKGNPYKDHSSNTQLQCLYSQGTRVFFPVQQPDHAIVGDTLYSRFLQSLPPQPKTQPIEALGEKEYSPLMRRLGWMRHVEGHDPVLLSSLVAGPRVDEEHLHRLKRMVKGYFKEVEEVVKKTPNEVILQWLNTDSKYNHDPYKALQNPESFQKYTTFFSRLFCFLLRVVKGDHPSYVLPLTSQQQAFCQDLHLVLEDGEDQERFNPIFHALAHSLLTFSPPQAVRDPHQYALICFHTLVNLLPDGHFCGPRDMTPKLAMLQWGFKGVVMRQIQARLDEEGDWLSSEELESLIRQEVSVLHAGRLSPFSSLLSSKALINHMAFSQPDLPNVYWRNTQKTLLVVNGERLELENLKEGIHRLEKDMTEYFEENLLLNLPLAHFPCPPLGEIVDHPSLDEGGYNFVEEETNPFKASRWRLVQHILEDEEQSVVFTQGLLDKVPLWRVDQLHQYLQ
ncbi:hypothetical protein TREMEDRAFT_66595, partial [Tremella mesenterica DSM 1558]|uniref:uncharacterized protein n=1 Tax=Tremella mesenterica (strain ATCC 24925 / CBS 8224 / DSM 1558 / NBRC 9311 / NRRL Y-6157 / RJB 2259-6 / UBC 559-6) TaxID=578456 RepID=UPI00032C83D5